MDTIIRIKASNLFIQIEESNVNNIHKIARKGNVTYSHAFKLIKHWEKKGFLILIKEGRDQKIFLTEKGIKIKSLLIKIEMLIK